MEVSLQEVVKIVKRNEVTGVAMRKEMKWFQAAEILGVSPRQLRRIAERWNEQGEQGLFDKRRCGKSPHQARASEVELVKRLYQEKYFVSPRATPPTVRIPIAASLTSAAPQCALEVAHARSSQSRMVARHRRQLDGQRPNRRGICRPPLAWIQSRCRGGEACCGARLHRFISQPPAWLKSMCLIHHRCLRWHRHRSQRFRRRRQRSRRVWSRAWAPCASMCPSARTLATSLRCLQQWERRGSHANAATWDPHLLVHGALRYAPRL